MSNTQYLLTPRPKPNLISLVVPLYNEEEVVSLLFKRLQDLLGQLPCQAQVVMVNDGSSDATIVKLRDIAQADRRFEVLSLARNFGHQLAATAGLDAARGDAIVLMDADLQNDPMDVPKMLQKLQKLRRLSPQYKLPPLRSQKHRRPQHLSQKSPRLSKRQYHHVLQ